MLCSKQLRWLLWQDEYRTLSFPKHLLSRPQHRLPFIMGMLLMLAIDICYAGSQWRWINTLLIHLQWEYLNKVWMLIWPNVKTKQRTVPYINPCLVDLNIGDLLAIIYLSFWGRCIICCHVMVWYWPILPLSFRVTSLPLRYLPDCPSASTVTLENIGTIKPLL